LGGRGLKSPRKLLVLLLIIGGLSAGVGAYVRFFQPQLVYKTGYGPIDIAQGDFNGDGNLDLATANRDDHAIWIYLGQGDGSFRKHRRIDVTDEKGVDTGNGPISLTTADLSSDGIVDIVITLCRNGCTSGSILLYKGDGKGNFHYHQFIRKVGLAPYNITLDHLNDDQTLDIVVSDYPSNLIFVLLSTVEGGYDLPLELVTRKKPIAVKIADLDGDGLKDIISSDHASEGSSIFMNLGNGRFADPRFYQSGVLPYAIEFRKIDDDEILDLIVAHSTPKGSVSLHYGDGQGGFHKVQVVDEENPFIGMIMADYNRDGLPDVVTTNEKENYASVLLSDGRGQFENRFHTIVAQHKIYAMVAGDYNHDGLMDLASVDFKSHLLFISLGTGLD